jgi:hypothetical protein
MSRLTFRHRRALRALARVHAAVTQDLAPAQSTAPPASPSTARAPRISRHTPAAPGTAA